MAMPEVVAVSRGAYDETMGYYANAVSVYFRQQPPGIVTRVYAAFLFVEPPLGFLHIRTPHEGWVTVRLDRQLMKFPKQLTSGSL